MKQWFYNTWYIFIYDLKKYYLKAPVLSWGILFPLTIILLVGTGFGNYSYSRMIPVGFTVGILFAATSIVQASISFEKMSGSINLILFLPIKSSEVSTAKILGGLLYGAIGAGIAGVSFYFTSGMLGFIHPWYFIISIVLGSIVFSLLSLFIAYAYEPIKAVAILNILRFTMLFLGGLFVPKPLIPFYLRPIVYVFPTVYTNDLIRYSLYNEWEYTDPITSIVMLLIYSITLAYVSYRTLLRIMKP
jgi:ABC-2 type transport system permease protein